jgi:O-acetyl-ADP-ribose deacetylase (regulator of RNase III)
MARVTAIEGDLTKQDVDAIVNAANPAMLGGGGVDGAIHRAAGRRLLAACREVPVGPGGRCPTGEARITPGFDLPARFVIHTVGPIWGQDPDPQRTLVRALTSSLALAEANGLKTIAVPAISTGVYGFPMPLAAELMVRAARAHEGGLEEIRFVLWGAAAHATFAEALARG